MGRESFGVVRFNFGPLLQGQTQIANLKIAYNSLIIGRRAVWDSKPTYRISWDGNLLVWSDLTLGPLFNVKRG